MEVINQTESTGFQGQFNLCINLMSYLADVTAVRESLGQSWWSKDPKQQMTPDNITLGLAIWNKTQVLVSQYLLLSILKYIFFVFNILMILFRHKRHKHSTFQYYNTINTTQYVTYRHKQYFHSIKDNITL